MAAMPEQRPWQRLHCHQKVLAQGPVAVRHSPHVRGLETKENWESELKVALARVRGMPLQLLRWLPAQAPASQPASADLRPWSKMMRSCGWIRLNY
jgi:hypothetical protein